MITKPVILVSCLAAAALVASPAMSAPRHARAGFGPHRVVNGTARMTPNYTRYGATWRSGNTWGHHHHHGGTSFVFYGGFPYYYGYPYYGYYPYWYWGAYPYGYYNYYGRAAYGYDGSSVVEVQRRLRNQGYYYGAIDGIVGPRTRAAIRGYEHSHGLPVDGVIDDQLLADLGLR